MESAFHVYFGPEAFRDSVKVRRIGPIDCVAALREGVDDFLNTPTHVAFLGIFYAVGGIVLAAVSSFGNVLHLIFPFAAGFALVGPFFAVGLYEISRRREAGLHTSWRDAFAVFHSPALPSIVGLGFYLLVLFGVWIGVSQLLYMRLFGPEPPAAAIPFVQDLLTSPRGWLLIFSGGLIGLCFAAVALCISLVSFPLMLDRDVGLVPAVVASMRLARENPGPVLLWGLVVAIGLALGAATLFIGMALIVPVLGHATWRLYRRAIVRDPRREVPIDTSDGKGLGEVKILKPLWNFLDLRHFLQEKRPGASD
jgi:uncharacterized membrane protein